MPTMFGWWVGWCETFHYHDTTAKTIVDCGILSWEWRCHWVQQDPFVIWKVIPESFHVYECCYAGTLNSSLHALFSVSDWRSVWAKKAAIWIGLCFSLKLEMNAQVKKCMFHWCTIGKWRNGNLHSSFGETSGPPKIQELSDSSCFSV